MVFSVDRDQKKIVATIKKDKQTENYECEVSACENPVCTCGTVYLELIPTALDDDNHTHPPRRRVEIDIVEKALGYNNIKEIPKTDLAFAKLFLSKLDEHDFQVLSESHFGYHFNR